MRSGMRSKHSKPTGGKVRSDLSWPWFGELSQAIKEQQAEHQFLTTDPLFSAILAKRTQEVKQLLAEGADVNITTPLGMTPLYLAAKLGLAKITKALLMAEAEPNPLFPLVNLVLHRDTYGAIGSRLRRHQDPEMVSPLLIATAGQHHAVMRLLLEFGANVHAMSALGEAITLHSETAELFEQYASQTNLTAMHIAAKNNDVKAMEILVEHGAYVDGLAMGKLPFYQWLPKAMRKPLWRLPNSHFCSITPLHVAAAGGHCEAAQFLLDHQSAVNITSVGSSLDPMRRGCTPLHFAALAGKTAMVKLLMKNGAHLNQLAHEPTLDHDPDKGTPLYFAAKHGHAEVVQVLLDEGANPNKAASNKPELIRDPLRIAANRGHVAVMKVLLDQKWVTANNRHGLIRRSPPPIMDAIRRLQLPAIRELLGHGVIVTNKMIQCAQDYGSQEIVFELRCAQRIQQAHYKNSLLRHPPLTKLKAIRDPAVLDKAIAHYERIVSFEHAMLAAGRVAHPSSNQLASSDALQREIAKAYAAFADNPLDDSVIMTLEKAAQAIRDSVHEAHQVHAFFNKRSCALEKRLDKVLAAKP